MVNINQPKDVFYINESEGYVLVASPDNFGGAPWGCPGTVISGADGTGYGDGQQNTADIFVGCDDGWYQALVVSTYEREGYDDWYIPSKDELHQLY